MHVHKIRYLDDPHSVAPSEIGFEFAPSFDAALDQAGNRLPGLRKKHGQKAGYHVEDPDGHLVWVWPGQHDDA